jgi:hypothetical protein
MPAARPDPPRRWQGAGEEGGSNARAPSNLPGGGGGGPEAGEEGCSRAGKESGGGSQRDGPACGPGFGCNGERRLRPPPRPETGPVIT